jgi:ATP-dependent Lon protease
MTEAIYAPDTRIEEVAIFPLPQVVLFPGVLMPLHVFEPRYRAMVRDVMATTRQIAVALIPEDHDIDEHGQPEIAEVAGIGEIVRCDALPDGRFNIVVEGKARVRLEELKFRRPYRRARATVVGSEPGSVDDVIVRALASTAARIAGAVRQCHPSFRFCVPESKDPGKLVDACAHYLVLDGEERQKLLETLDVGERVQRCLDVLLSQQAIFGGGGDVCH